MQFNLNDPAVAVALIALSVVGLVWALLGLKRLYEFLRLTQGYPNEEQIERYLMPLLRRAIVAVYEMSEHAMEHFGRVLESGDKRAIARALYDYLPDEVRVGPVVWNWKQVISVDEFGLFVHREFARLISWYRKAEENLLDGLKPEFG